MSATDRGAARAEWRANWGLVLVGLAGMMMISTGLYTLGVFVAPLQAAFGWSRVEVTSVTTVSAMIGICLGPMVGALVDKVGARRVGLPGCVLYCAALAGMSFTTQAIWTWWALWGLTAACGLMISPVVWTSGIAAAFDRSRGVALAVALCGSGVALMVLPNLARFLVDTFGWRAGFRGLAAVMFVTIAPLAFVFLRDTRVARARAAALHGAEAPAGLTARQAFRTVKFAKLAAMVLLFTVGVMSFSINLVPILTSVGLTRTMAAGMGAVIGVASVTGRVGTGFLLDRFNGNLVGAGTVLLPILGSLCFVLAPGSIPAAMAGTFVMGLALGAEFDVVAYLIARHFGTQGYGALFATLNTVLGIGAAIGPAMYSRFFDATGSYLPALWTTIPLYVLAAISVASLGAYLGQGTTPRTFRSTISSQS